MFKSVEEKTGESLAVFGYSCKMTVCKFRGKSETVNNSEREKSMSSKGIDIIALKVKAKAGNLGQKSSHISENLATLENFFCSFFFSWILMMVWTVGFFEKVAMRCRTINDNFSKLNTFITKKMVWYS